MANRNLDKTVQQAALVAGIGYIILLVFNTISNSLTLNNLIVWGDAATTVSNIMDSESLFRVGIASWLIVLVIDTVIAWALYVFLRPVNKGLSLLTAWFRLLFVAIAGTIFVGLFSALLLVNVAGDISLFPAEQQNALVMLFLNPYLYGFKIAFVFFGIHILGLGYLVLKSDYVPRILGIFLVIASAGYLIDSFASILSSSYAGNETLFMLVVALPALVAEYSLTFWLLVRGRKVTVPEKPASEIGQLESRRIADLPG